MSKFIFDVDVNGNRILNLGSPISGTDGVNRIFTDEILHDVFLTCQHTYVTGQDTATPGEFQTNATMPLTTLIYVNNTDLNNFNSSDIGEQVQTSSKLKILDKVTNKWTIFRIDNKVLDGNMYEYTVTYLESSVDGDPVFTEDCYLIFFNQVSDNPSIFTGTSNTVGQNNGVIQDDGILNMGNRVLFDDGTFKALADTFAESSYFYAKCDNTTNIPTSNVYVDVPLDTQLESSGNISHTIGSEEVTIDKNNVKVIVFTKASFENANTSRTTLASRLMVDTGGGYTIFDPSLTYGYSRTASAGRDSLESMSVLSLNQGDKLKMQVTKIGNGNISYTADNTTMSVIIPKVNTAAIDRQLASEVNTVTTTSQTFSTLSGMSLTTNNLGELGSYSVTFNASRSNNTSNDPNNTYQIFLDGVAITEASCNFQSFTNEIHSVSLTWVLQNVPANSVIDIRWRTTNGTHTCYNRRLTIDGIPMSTLV